MINYSGNFLHANWKQMPSALLNNKQAREF
jgi:hypothetical protein